jgi:putative glutathione S-transferase
MTNSARIHDWYNPRMGRMEAGKWVTKPIKPDANNEFVRKPTVFHDWIRSDGSTRFPSDANRYHLYAARACPWAHRTLIARAIAGLDEAVSISIVDPFMDDDGWHLIEGPGNTSDSVNGQVLLREIYLLADAAYTGRATVPILWDRTHGTIVNNESLEIIEMFDTEMSAHSANDAVALFPRGRRDEILAMIASNYGPVNNGVYAAGFAGSQEAHERAVRRLFARLDELDELLADQRFLCGAALTAADICLFTTLVRFDLVYHSHFKCNIRRLVDYANLWGFTRDVYQTPGVAGTTDFEHIKRHYYTSHESVNPRRFVPLGPSVDFDEPHGRR